MLRCCKQQSREKIVTLILPVSALLLKYMIAKDGRPRPHDAGKVPARRQQSRQIQRLAQPASMRGVALKGHTRNGLKCQAAHVHGLLA